MNFEINQHKLNDDIMRKFTDTQMKENIKKKKNIFLLMK